MKLGFNVEIIQGDALDIETDVLIIKEAAGSSGFDKILKKQLRKQNNFDLEKDIGIGNYAITESPTDFTSRYILCVGTTSVYELRYQQLRELGQDILKSLWKENIPDLRHITTTVHGVKTGAGNDEVEAFRSLLLGFADAYEAGEFPQGLETITIVEREIPRAELLQEALNQFLPTVDRTTASIPESTRMLAGVESFSAPFQRPVATDDTPHIFVAMPFADEFDDHYYLAIRPAVTNNQMLCLRLDQEESIFTGDIMEEVKKQIKSASLLIALLDGKNPNVYLEVGYAWGVGTPTILILNEDEQAPFDVQGSRILYYNRMWKLKEQLHDEIRSLL